MLNILTFVIGAYGGSVGVRAVRDKNKDFFDVIHSDMDWVKNKLGSVKEKMSHKDAAEKDVDSVDAKEE